ncbi:YpuI family protein [Robertmurraya sp. DFI.2.37]|uniref:YpuI family protein n=1 Tax=Robertmurraya sp. DFI.2.37 TaxID=3031819 RepID=UPI0012477D13|nr:YpuI family protein [Robertmurraya sp. DFI.2.37]MDF1507667.1 YpuI family protein [Robertmurraya sp. DFI.2.37]
MANTMVKSQLEDVRDFLVTTVNTLEDFLNQTTLNSLLEEEQGSEAYYKTILSNVRKLLVYCEEGLEACVVILQTDTFPKGAAEKTLYRIYHQCVEEFFQPKSDAWFEDSRAAYTGHNSIKFQEKVPETVVNLLKGLEGSFQSIREELEYYETDYRTKMIQSK